MRLVLVSIVTSLALSSAPSTVATQSTAGSITGRVVDGTTNEAIQGATVSISRVYRSQAEAKAALGNPRIPPVTTGADGSFTFSSVAPGPGDLTIRARKFAYTGGYFGQAAPSGDETIQHFDLRSGEEAKGVVLRLWKASVLSGRIRTQSNEPIPGKWVQAFRVSNWGPGALELQPLESPVKSDEQGEYRFPGLNPGRYLVQASEMQPPALFEQTYALLSPKRGIPSLIDLSASPVFYPNALSPVQSRLVVVTAGQDTTSIDITVPSTLNVTSISGRIRNLPAGLSSCRVRLTASSAELGENFEVTATDSAGDGSFVFTNVAPGTYVIRGIAWPEDVKGQAMWFSRDVIVGNDPIRDLDIVAQPGAKITGRVAPDGNLPFTAEELRGMNLPVDPIAGWNLQGRPLINVELDNTFSTFGLPAGRVHLGYVLPFGMAARVLVGNVDVRDTGIELAGKDVDVTVVVRRQPTTIEGIVVDSAGTPRPDGYLVWFPYDQRAWNTRTIRRDRPDRFGKFSLQVGPGDYAVAAVEGGLPEDFRSPEFLTKLKAGALRVVVDRANVTSQQVRIQRVAR